MIVWLKVGAFAVLAALVGGGGFYLGTLRGTAKASAAQAAQEAARAAQLQALASAWQGRELQFEAEEDRRDAEIETLRTAALEYPIGPVRLCHLTLAAPAGTAGAPVPAGAHQPAAAGLVPAEPEPLPQSPGPDFGPVLSSLADDADTLVAACRATQPITPSH